MLLIKFSICKMQIQTHKFCFCFICEICWQRNHAFVFFFQIETSLHLECTQDEIPEKSWILHVLRANSKFKLCHVTRPTKKKVPYESPILNQILYLISPMCTLEFVQQFFTSFGYWNFWGFSSRRKNKKNLKIQMR